MNAKSASRSGSWLLAALLLASVAPAHAKDFTCQFQATGLALNFGNIDPSNAVQVVKAVQAVNLNASDVGDCNGGPTLDISVVGATSRVLSNGTDTIPYTIAGFPITMSQPGNNRYVNFLSPAMTGTIPAGTYANASAGTYTDTVTISVSP
jgi:spore coat protein U-like protein